MKLTWPYNLLPVWLLIGCLAGLAVPVRAADGIAVATLDGTLDLDQRIELLEDVSGSLTFADIVTPAVADRFAHVSQASPNFGFSTSAWWVRLTLANDGEWLANTLLRQDYPLIDYLDLWHRDIRGEWQVFNTGDRRAFSSRDLQHRDFIFRIQVPARSTRTVYMRFASSGPINIGLSLSDESSLVKSVGTEQLGFGMYFGGFLVLLVYNLFIFIAVRDRAFFHYLLYLAFYGAYFAVHNGLTFQFLWPNNPWWGNKSLVVLLALTLFWGVQFSRSILNSKHVSPRLDKVAAFMQWLSVAGLVGAVFLPYSRIIFPLAALSAMAPPLLLWMGSISLLAGHRTARYFMLAWSMLLIGVSAYMLKSFGLLPHNFITQNGFQIGSLVEMVLLSLALASRVSELQRHSITDGLTGLYNRRNFDEKLEEEFLRSTRYGQPLSLMLIDADSFKQYNDTHGHRFGDDALRAIAGVLRKNARQTDHICRYGGEEFVILMPATGSADAQALAERQRERIEAYKLSRGTLTISVGIATLTGGSFRSGSGLVDAADKALYEAKRQGRNRVVCAATKETVSDDRAA